MAQPAPELVDLITKARARGYQVVRSGDGNGWLVTTGGFKRRPKFEGRWRLASDVDLAKLLERILNTKVGTGYPQQAPRRGPVQPIQPAPSANTGDPWAKAGQRKSLGIFDGPPASRR